MSDKPNFKAVEEPNAEASAERVWTPGDSPVLPPVDDAHYTDEEYAQEVEALKDQADATFEEMTPAQKEVIRGMPGVFEESNKVVNAEAHRLEEARHGVPLPGVGGIATDRDGRPALDEGGRPRLKAEFLGEEVPAATREKEVLHLDADDVPYYEDWLADDLREELGARGLTKSGKKDELVARLYADDEETGA